MKIHLLTYLFLLITSFSFSQSKSETEKWITYQLEENKCKNCLLREDYKIEFSNGLMIAKWISSDGIRNVIKIPLKSIQFLTIKKSPDIDSEIIQFNCGKKTCIEYGKEENEIYTKIEELERITLYFDGSLGDNELPARLRKSFKKLIELNGGKLIDGLY